MHFYRNRADQASIQVERIQNVAGSTAGAGSADYYAYRNRRRDALAQENLQEREQILSAEQKMFEAKVIAERTNLAQKQKKRKDKRLKKKQNKATTKLAKRLNKFKNDGTFLNQVEGGENLGKRGAQEESGSEEDSEASQEEQELIKDPKSPKIESNKLSGPEPTQAASIANNAANTEEAAEPRAEKRQKTS